MSFRKKRITEELAAAKFVAKTKECVRDSWPDIYQRMKDLFEHRFVVKEQTQAASDLTLASIALGIQAIRNLNQRQKAERLQAWILRCINKEYGEYAISEIKEYDRAFQEGSEGISQGKDPIMEVSARLLHRWLGSDLHTFGIKVGDKKTVVFEPLLVMMTADVLIRYAGIWRALCDAYEVLGNDFPHDFSSDDRGAMGMHELLSESEKQRLHGTIRYLAEHDNTQAQGAGPVRKATGKAGIGLTRGNWILLGIAALICGLCALIALFEKHSDTSSRKSSAYSKIQFTNDQGMPSNIYGQPLSYSSPIRNSKASLMESNHWVNLAPRDIFTDPEFFMMSREARRIVAAKAWKDFGAASLADQNAALDAPISYWRDYFKEVKPLANRTVFGPPFSDFAVTFMAERWLRLFGQFSKGIKCNPA